MQLYMFGSPPKVVAPEVVAPTATRARETPHQRRRRGAVEASPAVEQATAVEPMKVQRASREKLSTKPVVEQTMWAVYTGPVMDVAPVGQKPEILPAESADEAVRVVSAWKANRGGPRWALPWTAGDDAKPVELEAVALVEATEPADIAREIVGGLQEAIATMEGVLVELAEPAAAPVESASVAPTASPRASSKASRRSAAEDDDHRSPLEIVGDLARAEHELADALGGLAAMLTEGTSAPAPPLLTACVVDGVAMLTCEAGTVPVADVLARVLATDGVGFALLADVAREIAMGEPLPGQLLDGDLGASLVSLFTRSNRRAELEIKVLERQHAAILGCTLDELPARLAADKAKESARVAEEKAARQNCGAIAVKPASDATAEQPINDAAARDAQYLADCDALAAEQRQYERSKKPVHAPAPKRAARGSKASPIAAPAGPADVAGQSMRRLTDRQIELVKKLNVVNGRAIYGTGSEEHIADWDDLKSTMLALDGSWQKANKKKQIHGGFTFPEGVDVEETIRLAQTTGEVLDPKLAGFFATPVEHAKGLAARLGIQPGWRVLEPSAGTGRLAVAARDLDAVVECVEPLPKNRAALEELGFKIIGVDLMAMSPIEVFAAVLMNPPFQHEIAHIMHAGRFLHSGGPVVSIASAGIEFRTTKDAIAFRAFLTAHGGTIEAMPEGSFLESGTGVRTVIVEYKACAGCRAGTCESR